MNVYSKSVKKILINVERFFKEKNIFYWTAVFLSKRQTKIQLTENQQITSGRISYMFCPLSCQH